MIVSLPHSGAEILQNIFENSTDFLYLPFDALSIPIGGNDQTQYDACYWPRSELFAIATGWFRTLSTEPLLFLNNHPTNSKIEKIRRKFRENEKGSRFALSFTSGFWNSKVSSIESLGN